MGDQVEVVVRCVLVSQPCLRLWLWRWEVAGWVACGAVKAQPQVRTRLLRGVGRCSSELGAATQAEAGIAQALSVVQADQAVRVEAARAERRGVTDQAHRVPRWV